MRDQHEREQPNKLPDVRVSVHSTRLSMKCYKELYGACWQAWKTEHFELTNGQGWKPSRRCTQWRVMGDYMWSAFCMQWVAIAYVALIGKE